MGRNISIVSERLGSGFKCEHSHSTYTVGSNNIFICKRETFCMWMMVFDSHSHIDVVSHACSSSSFLPQFFSSGIWRIGRLSFTLYLSSSQYMSVFVRVVIMHIYLLRELSVRINTSVYSFIPVPMLLRELMFLQYRSCNSNRYIKTKI